MNVGCLTLMLRTAPPTARQSITRTQHLPPAPVHQDPTQLDTIAFARRLSRFFLGFQPRSLRTRILISLLLLSSVSF